MNIQVIGLILLFGLAVGLAIPVGRYLSRVFKGERTLLDFLAPLDRLLFRLGGIDPTAPMTWRQYAVAMLTINGVWLLYALALLLVQASVPVWNQQNIPSMEWTLALNTAIGFLTSTNLQHYSGESGATYFSQMAVLMFLQFMSAGTSLAVGIAVVRALQNKTGESVGNFYQDFGISITRVFLPLSLLGAVLLVLTGVPMTFSPDQVVHTLTGIEQTIATGPVAAMLPIKHLGSNGGGFFGANTAHPFENPNFVSYSIHLINVLLLPMAFICFVGYFLNRRKLGIMLFTIMTGFLLALTIPIISQEMSGNAGISHLGIDQTVTGSVEGKEVRFGTAASAFWCGVNIAIPAGTLTSMHDSYTPLSGVFMLLGMQLDVAFGGVGTGFLYLFLYIIIAIFIGSLMIGRTPELLGKKVGLAEIQIAVFVTVALPLLYLGATGLAVAIQNTNPGIGWLINGNARSPYHGFTTMLYEFVSSAGGNGSGFEGLNDNTPFWNLSTAVVIFFGRFISLIGPLAIAGILYGKQYTPPTMGVLPTESYTFGLLLTAIIIIIGALCFIPALAIGPIAEYLTQ